MTQDGVELPYAAWPHTQVLASGSAFHVTGRYRAVSWWWERGFPVLLFIIWIAGPVMSCAAAGNQASSGTTLRIWLSWTMWLAVIGVAGVYFATRRSLDVKLSPGTITIDGRPYARNVRHSYELDEHERAYRELAAARRTAVDRNFTFRDAKQVVMRYGERRIPIAEFSGHDLHRAEALVIRLQDLDRRLDHAPAVRKGGNTPPSGPSDKLPPVR